MRCGKEKTGHVAIIIKNIFVIIVARTLKGGSGYA
jgi:hypothetical protein